MYLTDYYQTFPERINDELRTVTFLGDDDAQSSIPSGKYAFLEFYCTDLSCQCNRVLIKALRVNEADENELEDVATISYTWETVQQDSHWQVIRDEMPNPTLDPLNENAPYADELLDFWQSMVERDEQYAKRLIRHYDQIRAAVGSQPDGYEFDSAKFGRKRAKRPMLKLANESIQDRRKRYRKLHKRRGAQSR